MIVLAVLCAVAFAADIPAPPAPRPGVQVVDDPSQQTPEALVAPWRTQDAACAPAEALLVGGRPVIKLTCNFEGTAIPRGVWDREVSLDLSTASAISFDVYGEHLQAIGSAQVYLRSGPGWYGCSWFPPGEGKWCHVRLLKSHFFVDRAGAGWARIDAIRFSPWAMKRENAVLYVANLGVERPTAPAIILRQEYTDAAKKSEQGNADKFTQTVADLLEAAGISLPLVNSPDLTAEMLAKVRVVLVPYVSALPADVTTLLTEYLDAGGKIIGSFSLPGPIAERLGVSQKGWRGAAFPGEFSSMRFVDGELPGVPRTVGQKSWGLVQVAAIEGRGTVAAWWHSADGAKTDAPAVIASPAGVYISHVVLEDDPVAKRAMLKGLIAGFCPEVARQACETRIAIAGTTLGAADWDSALQLVGAEPGMNERAAEAMGRARDRHAEAQAQFAAGSYDEACELVEKADAELLDAYCLAQRGSWPEFRATWCHPVPGVEGWSWDRTAEFIKQNGVDHLILNALHGASAGYPSKVLPTDATLPAGSDAFAQCVAACRKHGIKLHVWMTNYQSHGHAPKEFLERLKADGRLQVDVDGNPAEQLCPSDERNLALQRDAMVEAARIDGVAGIHFDYIRYPDGKKCYCPTCRSKFEARIGHRVENWPHDVLGEGPVREEWLQFRRDNITRLVREVHAEVRRVAPDCIISAAVFSGYPGCRDDVGQDWKLWVDEGLLDFVCPMDYTGSDAEFSSRVRTQLELVGGRIPCYPGIGLLEHKSPADAVRQIRITREQKTGGFVLWSVYPQYLETYSSLGKGVMARE